MAAEAESGVEQENETPKRENNGQGELVEGFCICGVVFVVVVGVIAVVVDDAVGARTFDIDD